MEVRRSKTPQTKLIHHFHIAYNMLTLFTPPPPSPNILQKVNQCLVTQDCKEYVVKHGNFSLKSPISENDCEWCRQHNALLNSVDYFQFISLTPECLIRNLSRVKLCKCIHIRVLLDLVQVSLSAKLVNSTEYKPSKRGQETQSNQ